MHQNFREPDKAVSWLLSGLMTKYPDERAEVIRMAHQRVVRVFCPMSEVGHLLRRFCRKFTNASVHYHPDNRYGFVGEVRCHGNYQGVGEERPRVVVLLADVTNEDVLETTDGIKNGRQPGKISERGPRATTHQEVNAGIH